LQRELVQPIAREQAGKRTQVQSDVAQSKVEFFTLVRGEA
jgi:alpha-D-ribose 1-methylphosphonate 5-triphosphate synthase subunit PhnG